jgi:hypothetical protein
LFVQERVPATALIQSAFNQGQFQAYGSEGMLDTQLPIESNLSVLPDANGLGGTITNSSSWNLTDVTLVLGDNYLYLGNLPAREHRKVTFSFKRQPNLFPRQNVEMGLYGATIASADSTSDTNETQDLWQRNLRWTMLNTAYLNGRFSALYQSYSLYLTGWLEGTSVSELVGTTNVTDGLKMRQQNFAFLIKPLPFSYQPDSNQTQILIPAPVLVPNHLSSSNTSPSPDGSGNIKLSPGSSMVLQYRLPAQLNMQATRLSFFVMSRREDRNGPVATPQLEIFDWNRQSWEVITNQGDTRQQIDLTNPTVSSFIEPIGGFIRIRVSTKSDLYLLQQLNIEVQGIKQ